MLIIRKCHAISNVALKLWESNKQLPHSPGFVFHVMFTKALEAVILLRGSLSSNCEQSRALQLSFLLSVMSPRLNTGGLTWSWSGNNIGGFPVSAAKKKEELKRESKLRHKRTTKADDGKGAQIKARG